MVDDQSLVNGGDCNSHWHSEDRVPSQDFLRGLETVAKQVTVAGDTILTGREDFVLVDTSASNITITLPRAISGFEQEIMKLSSANSVIVLPDGSDTILGTTGVTLAVGGAAIRFKAIGTDWRPI